MKLIYNIIVYAYFISISIVFLILSAIVFVICYPFDKRRYCVHKLSTWWTQQCFLRLNPFWTCKFSGKELIDKKTTYIIVSNHQSMIDIGMMYYVPLVFKWVSKSEVLKWPLVGQMLYLHGDIMIKRGEQKSARKLLSEAQKWLSRGASVAIFPEGTRTKDGRIHKFKEGAFLLAKQTKTAILPVVMDGSFEVLPKSGIALKMKHTFHLKVLPAISVEEVENTSIKEMMQRVENLMREEHKKIAPKFYEEE